MTAASRFLVIVLVVPGIVALAAVIHYVEPAKDLPAFFPGHAAHLKGQHTTRGLAGIIAGAAPYHRCDHRTPRQTFVSPPLRDRPGPRIRHGRHRLPLSAG